MGTAIGLDLREPFVAPAVVEDFFAWIVSVDARFSTYKPHSLVSRMRRGESTSDPDMAEVEATCERVREASGGAFDAWRHSPDGFDPSAVVKGWSADRGAAILRGAGARNFCINAGGDVLALGEPVPGAPWRVGIRHPVEADKVAAVLGVRNCAVATSGAYERGRHIRVPGSDAPPHGLLSVTVAGPTLALADAYSTAAFVMGAEAPAWLAQLPAYSGMVITDEMRGVSTDGFARMRVD